MKKTRMLWLPTVKTVWWYMYSRFNTIPACDGQTDEHTDRQTSCDSIVRAIASRSKTKWSDLDASYSTSGPWGQGMKLLTLGSELRRSKVAYDFLLLFYSNYSNYGHILYRFPDIARCWSKIAKFIYPTCVQCPRMGWPRRNLAKVFIIILGN